MQDKQFQVAITQLKKVYTWEGSESVFNAY